MGKLQKVKSRVGDLGSTAQTIVIEQAANLSDFLKTKNLKSVFSLSTSSNTVVDTTHYFLLPSPYSSGQYILHTHREVPAYVDDHSTVEFRRVLHVPTEQHIDIVKRLLHDQIKQTLMDKQDDPTFALTLDQIANQIDKSNEKITNGLIIAGVAVTLVNPITGIAIIGASFLPDVATEFVSASFKSISSSIKKSSQNKANSQADSIAAKDIRSVPVDVRLNIILFKIEKCVLDAQYNALSDVRDDAETLKITAPVIRSTYHINQKWSFFTGNRINDNLKQYIEFLVN